MILKNLLVALASVLISLSTLAEVKPLMCDKSFAELPVQQRGRVKPIYVHAKETVKLLTGKSKPIDGLTPTQVYCLLSMQSTGLLTEMKLLAPIEHVDLKNFLDVPEGKKQLPYENLLGEVQTIRMEMFKQQEESSYKKALVKLLNRIGLYQNVVNGQDWTVPLKNAENNVEWTPLVEFLKNKNEGGAAGNVKDLLFAAKADYDSVEKELTYQTELTFAKLGLPHWALLFSLLALIFGIGFKNFNYSLGMSAVTVLTQLVYLTFRIYISGRAPITNMYETVLFSGFGGMIMAMGIGHYKKEKAFVLVGLGYNICTLFMINFAHGMLDPGINPLVPVLRDNFWLSTHVTTIIMSYGALALSWIMANVVMVRRRFYSLDKAQMNYYVDLMYTCLKYGTILLAAGIILGGVWADYSWGRFWGWDPKETWSLIVLCLYMAILHGKYTSWIPNERFTPLVAAAFLSVMMAWFGVNYILASGLHSYGFSEGGAVFLGSFFAIQIAILIVTQIGLKKE